MNLKTDNWYYIQAFADGIIGGHTTICFAVDKNEARIAVKQWLTEKNINPTTARVHYYHRNYKREAAAMVAANNYIHA